MIPSQQAGIVALQASRAAIIAHQASEAAHQATHSTIRFSLHHYRNAGLLANRFVGQLSQDLVQFLGLRTTARQVFISADAQRHTITRRAVVSHIDSELVASRITEAFANVQYWVVPQRDPRVFELLGHVSSADRWLLLALKHVPAESASSRADELWIRTAHPFGKKKFAKAQKTNYLRHMQSPPSNPSLHPTCYSGLRPLPPAGELKC